MKMTINTNIDDIDSEYSGWLVTDHRITDIDKLLWWIRIIVIILLKSYRDKWY